MSPTPARDGSTTTKTTISERIELWCGRGRERPLTNLPRINAQARKNRTLITPVLEPLCNCPGTDASRIWPCESRFTCGGRQRMSLFAVQVRCDPSPCKRMNLTCPSSVLKPASKPCSRLRSSARTTAHQLLGPCGYLDALTCQNPDATASTAQARYGLWHFCAGKPHGFMRLTRKPFGSIASDSSRRRVADWWPG